MYSFILNVLFNHLTLPQYRITHFTDSRTDVRLGLLSESEFELFGLQIRQKNSNTSPTTGLMDEFQT